MAVGSSSASRLSFVTNFLDAAGSCVVDGNDVRMIEIGGRFGFGAKPFDGFGRGELFGCDELESDGAIETELARTIGHAHPAASDFAKQLVIAEVTRVQR